MVSRRGGGPPAWFIFLLSVAFILGAYQLWLGARNYVRTGGLGVVEATERAVVISTATAVQRATQAIPTATLIPTFTPPPPCQDWVVTVSSANVRFLPDTNAQVVRVFEGGTTICVIERVPDTTWYKIDANPETRRIDEAYMRGDVIRPLNPTETPTLSPTPLPTVTPVTPVTLTPSFTPSVTPTTDPNITPSPQPTETSTSTPSPTETRIPPTETPTPSLRSV